MPRNCELIFAVAIVNVPMAVAAVRSVAAAIRVLANWSSFDNPFRASDCGLARLFPHYGPARLPSH